MRIQSKRITALTVYIDSTQFKLNANSQQAGAYNLTFAITAFPPHDWPLSLAFMVNLSHRFLQESLCLSCWKSKQIKTTVLRDQIYPNISSPLSTKIWQRKMIFCWRTRSNYTHCTLHQRPQTIPNRKSLLPELLTASDNLMKLQHDISRERLDALEWSFCWDLIKHLLNSRVAKLQLHLPACMASRPRSSFVTLQSMDALRAMPRTPHLSHRVSSCLPLANR